MPDAITTVGFDADDTLWQNEQFFRLTEARFAELLSPHTDTEHLSERLLAAEKRNLRLYGFGIKGFVLSMVETAVDVTEGKVPSSVIAEILAAGLMRLHARQSTPLSAHCGDSSLDCAAQQSGHADRSLEVEA